MRKIELLLLVVFVIFSAACLGEGVKNAEMTLDTKVAEVTGTLNSTEVLAAEFMEMYNRGDDFVLIDVRTKREFDDGYIPGAVHIPYTELDTRIDELGLSKDQKIVLYCEAGVRSKKGANALLNREFTNIIDVTDGIRGWKALGGELKIPSIETPTPKTPQPTPITPTTIQGSEIPITTTTMIKPVTTTSTTIGAPQSTGAPITEQSYLSVEPIRIIETLDSPITVQMDHWDAVKIEDSYIYITGDFDGCSGEIWWYFNIYHDTPAGGVWEGKTKSYDLYKVHSNQDISPQIHEVSDALDMYTIVVKKWDVQEGLTLEISK
jgi:rhodanese-related sulfurtransferase